MPPEVIGVESGYDTTKETSEDTKNNIGPEVKGNVISGAHRAGFDAFMTGFAFATYLVHNTSMEKTEPISRLLGVPIQPQFADFNIVNRIYLVCKDSPFMIRKSAYTKNSAGHAQKTMLAFPT